MYVYNYLYVVSYNLGAKLHKNFFQLYNILAEMFNVFSGDIK